MLEKGKLNCSLCIFTFEHWKQISVDTFIYICVCNWVKLAECVESIGVEICCPCDIFVGTVKFDSLKNLAKTSLEKINDLNISADVIVLRQDKKKTERYLRWFCNSHFMVVIFIMLKWNWVTSDCCCNWFLWALVEAEAPRHILHILSPHYCLCSKQYPLLGPQKPIWKRMVIHYTDTLSLLRYSIWVIFRCSCLDLIFDFWIIKEQWNRIYTHKLLHIHTYKDIGAKKK